MRSLNGRQSTNPQVPITAKPPAPPPGAFPGKSTFSSNKSQGSTSAAQDPYAPAVHNKASLRDDYSNRNIAHSRPFGSAYDDSSSQELSIKPFTLNTAYAPSPSLVGANDTLGRISARAPVFSFGFGGKLVTCFHGAASLSTGFDVALSSRNSTGVTIRVLKDIIPESALGTSSVSFPGPLLGDPGASTSIVRTGALTQTKTKKAKVVKYLEERIDEISRGLGYVQVGSVETQKLDGKLVLVKLLKLMVDNDGKLLGTPQLDDAVRSILVPRLEGSSSESSEGTGNIIPAYSRSPDVSQSIYGSVSPNLSDSPISVTTLRPSALDRIEDFLLRGERRKAYHFALDEKLWAHAMVIASSIDKEAWKEVVNEFLKNELALKNDTSTSSSMYGADSSVNFNGRESLRVAYSLFSGQGAAAVQELAPQNLLARVNGRLQPAVISTMTPRTPNFAALGASPIPVESLSNWAETVAMMIFSPLTSETSSALTALGDQLVANKWTDAAHACYLLSPQTSIMGGLGNPAFRIVLVGSQSPSLYPSFTRDPDPFIFSEIVEFALSLTPTVKGQEPFIGLPHLQAYRFVRAISLVELGDMQLGSRYCEAITASLTRGSPYFTPALLEQLKGLEDRINGIHQGDKSGSWIGGKLTKPSLDTIGGWLEGRFTKLVTGDADTPTTSEPEVSKTEDRPFAGPFSHYSTISSTTPSARSSPQPTTVNHNVFPPPRTGSALSSSPYAPSAAPDYAKPALSPNPYGVSAAYPQSPSVAHGFSSYAGNNYSPSEDLMTPKPSNESNDEDDNAQEASWWGATSYTDSSSTKTPTTATFMKVDEGVPASSDGFISLMDNHNFSVGPSSTRGETPHSTSQDDGDDDDLGLGNPKKEKREAQQEGEKEKTTPAAVSTPTPSAPARPELKPTSGSSGSWFSLSRLWKRDEALTPGPVKASLGEESAFYYDKELKRWVNKKAGAEAVTKPAAPPPPPSRAQTASPGMTGPRAPPPSSNGSNPTRSASAIDLSTSPPSNKPVMRVRSNLVPPPESAPSTPTGTRLAPPGPPPGRPKSQASKRNIRNRYVDVFSQENGGA
ncbi:Sec23-binding domain of Sec16-domain-containing protein [Crucibulum laeve]|uniref:Protein transport protein sec16 n=1 Tax=Crucibulum laeve TaxID=68775 RepID=A0A5C3MDS4_9AGAR|nr:Sec23-binding domain of Sec16-domain-containing protein [Crucibulum laeve]